MSTCSVHTYTQVMECEVEMGNSHMLLRHTRKEDAGVEPDPSNADDVQTIKVMDTDSVSQTKEKLLDFIYGNRPVSKRPSIAEVELGTVHLVLKRVFDVAM